MNEEKCIDGLCEYLSVDVVKPWKKVTFKIETLFMGTLEQKHVSPKITIIKDLDPKVLEITGELEIYKPVYAQGSGD